MLEDAALPSARDEPTPPPLVTGTDAAAATPLALTALHEVLRALGQAEPERSVLQIIAQQALVLTRAASVTVVLLSPNRETADFVAAAGVDAAVITGTRVRAEDTVAGNVARTGEPFLAFRPVNLDAVTLYAPFTPSLISIAAVPVFARGEPVGALVALNKQDGLPFSGDDLLALSTLASAGGVALANERLRADTDRQGRELSVLYEAVRSVSKQLSTRDALQAAVAQASAHLNCAAVVIFLRGATENGGESATLFVAEEIGLPSGSARERTLPADLGLGWAAMQATHPLFLTFALTDEQERGAAGSGDGAEGYNSPFPEVAARSGLAVAIRSGDAAPRGVLLVLSRQGDNAFSLADANLLSAVGSQVAVALDNAALYEDAVRRAEEAAALYELSQSLGASFQRSEVLERVADSVQALLQVDKLALFLKRSGDDGREMTLATERGLSPGADTRLRHFVGQGIPGWVAEFETPTAIDEVRTDRRNASLPLDTEGVTSLVATPLHGSGGVIIGTLCALSDRRRRFTVAEVELLYTIANQAATALENARMFDEVQHKGRELRRYFHQVARALGSSQEPQSVPLLIAQLTQELMGADRCALYTRAPASEQEDGAENGVAFLHLQARAGFRLATETSREEGGASPPVTVNDATPTGLTAHRKRPVIATDINEDARFSSEKRPRAARGRIGSYLGVPLRSGAQTIGVLEVYTRAPRVWRGDEARLLSAFASQAAVAFQNARLLHQGEDAEREARLLRRLLAAAAAPASSRATEIVTALSEFLNNAAVVCLRRDDIATPWMRFASAGDDADTVTARVAETLNKGGTEIKNAVALFVQDPSGATAILADKGPTTAQIKIAERHGFAALALLEGN